MKIFFAAALLVKPVVALTEPFGETPVSMATVSEIGSVKSSHRRIGDDRVRNFIAPKST